MAQRITDKTGDVMAAVIVRQCEELLAISSQNKIIRTPVDTIRSMSRLTQGVRVMDLDDNAVVVSVDCWEAVEEEDDQTNEPTSPAQAKNQIEMEIAPGVEATNGHVAAANLQVDGDEVATEEPGEDDEEDAVDEEE